MTDERMPLHMRWRKDYEKNRFCRHLSEEELQQRVRDIVLNMLILTPEGKVGLGSPENEESLRWMYKWTQVLQEMQLRYGPYPNGFTNGFMKRDRLPDFVGELGKKAACIFAERKLDSEKVIVKYGKSEHMGALIARGQLRIQPASYFAAHDHNGAIRDDELNLAVSVVLAREEVLALVVNPQDVAENSGDQTFKVNYHSKSDYWLYCVTRSLEPRLFVDFGADACVIIKDRVAFAERLQRVAALKLDANTALSGEAMYVDPHQPSTAKIPLPLAKHFRYSYQQEVRFAWLPHAPAKTLTPVDIEIGPLDDIVEFISL